jgi:hypothetical protein
MEYHQFSTESRQLERTVSDQVKGCIGADHGILQSLKWNCFHASKLLGRSSCGVSISFCRSSSEISVEPFLQPTALETVFQAVASPGADTRTIVELPDILYPSILINNDKTRYIFTGYLRSGFLNNTFMIY